jgi:benzoyl-CoA reductase subunit BamC
VYADEINDVYVPIRAGHYSRAECNGRNLYKIDSKEYAECAFCSAVCPSRERFRLPDSGLPLQCDMCEDTPPLPEPMCVQACKFGALTYEIREVEGIEEIEHQAEVETGLEALTEKYGLQKVVDTISRMSSNSKRNLDS